MTYRKTRSGSFMLQCCKPPFLIDTYRKSPYAYLISTDRNDFVSLSETEAKKETRPVALYALKSMF